LLNRPPVLTYPEPVPNFTIITVNEGNLVEITATAIDPNNDTLTYSINDTTRFAQNGATFTWQTDFTDEGHYEFEITVTDGSLGDSRTFSVNVTKANRAPVITPINKLYASINKTRNFTVQAFDPDGDGLIYSINDTKGGTITNIGNTFSWTPTPSQWGVHELEAIVSDGQAESREPFTIEAYFCGDVNHSGGTANLGDIIYLVNYIFKGGPAPNPLVSGDVNSAGAVNLSDIVYLVNYIFKGGPAPNCSTSSLNN